MPPDPADNIVQLREKKDRPSDLEFDQTARYICDEVRRRAANRSDYVRIWREIDRQVAMRPEPRRDADGRPLRGTDWMPEFELSLQAATLETDVADVMRLQFPRNAPWFAAHALVDKEYLDRVKGKPLLAGDGSEVTRQSVQEDADALIQATLLHFQKLTDHRQTWKLLHAESRKYGVFVARYRRVRLEKMEGDYRDEWNGRRVPVLQARSIKNVYLDDREHAILGEGLMVSPMIIEDSWANLDDIRLAAMKNKKSEQNEDGGWLPANLVGVQPLLKSTNMVQVFDVEGDITVPCSDGSTQFLENCTMKVIYGKGGPKVVKFAWREYPFRSYVVGYHFHHEIMAAYGDGPLKTGAPLHKISTEAMNRSMQAAALLAQPPVKWDPNDWRLAARGGPRMEPNALWDATTNPEAIAIGNPSPLFQFAMAVRGDYAESTASFAPRSGRGTKSHQAAFSVGAEIDRGMLRTMSYCADMLEGPATRTLRMGYVMARTALKDDLIWVAKFNEFVRLSKNDLPDAAEFEAQGADEPFKEMERQQKQIQAMTLALQVETAKVNLQRMTGQPQGRRLNLEAIQRDVLRDAFGTGSQGFFVDTGAAEGNAAIPPEQPGASGVPGLVSSNPADILAAVG